MTQDQKVLIVEDEASLRNILGDKLTSAGIEVLLAKDGKEALEIALRERPALILLDLLLPEVSGIQVLQKLQADDWGKDATVIVLTNVSKQEKIADAVLAGSSEYLIKSDWTIKEITAKVKEKLAQ